MLDCVKKETTEEDWWHVEKFNRCDELHALGADGHAWGGAHPVFHEFKSVCLTFCLVF
jgi:hypothetical protein